MAFASTSPPSASSTSIGDRVLIVLALAFGFLLASFPARNSDLWLHLANGRGMVQGSFSNAAHMAAASNSWLFDLMAYIIYSTLGGAGLVVGKALLAAGIAWLLLQLSKAGTRWGLAGFCTFLSLLTMGSRLLLQPATVSYFFMALAAWLMRPRPAPIVNRLSAWLPPWSLLALFVIWANSDRWFVVGLAVVGLTWLGEWLDAPQRTGTQRIALSKRLVNLLILAAACLLNPAHGGAFSIPSELRVFGQADQGSALSAAGRVLSPFREEYYAHIGLTPVGLAYFVLLGLSLASFLFNISKFLWSRFLPWMALGVLTVYQVRATPFFAVLAGPALAWNLHGIVVRLMESPRLSRQGLEAVFGLGRFLTVVLGLALVILAWPGFLQSPPFGPRRWVIETPPSLEAGARITQTWLAQGRFSADSHGLHLSADTANAFAWFCPEEKSIRDESLISILLTEPTSSFAWVRPMRSAGIDHVIVYDLDRNRLFAAMGRFLADPEQFPLLYMEGDLAAFGWRDPAQKNSKDLFKNQELNADRLAFHPSDELKAPRHSIGVEPRPWWHAFWEEKSPRTIETKEATLHLLHAEVIRRLAPFRHLIAWEQSQTASLIGAAAGWRGPASLFDAALRLGLIRPPIPNANDPNSRPLPIMRLARVFQQGFTMQREDTSPALLFLAIRAARRALIRNPDDEQAYLVLGQSYFQMLRATRERAWAVRFPPIAQLRNIQASEALNRAIQLKPDLAQAHLTLSALYEEMNCLDLALAHLQAYAEATARSSQAPETGSQPARDQNLPVDREITRLEKLVREQKDALAKAGSLRVQDRADLAKNKGLAGVARDILLESTISAFGPQGMALELELLLKTGRARDVVAWTGDEQKAVLGEVSFYGLRTQALAAVGDYGPALEECRTLASLPSGGEPGRDKVSIRNNMALAIARFTLERIPGTIPLWYPHPINMSELGNLLEQQAAGLRHEADMTVMLGLLALEQGDVEQAAVAFRAALSIWKDEAFAASGAGLDFSARIVAETMLSWLD